MIQTKGFWIGILDTIEGLEHDQELVLEKNDVLLLYTDGITEAWRDTIKSYSPDKKDDVMFGEKRLVEVMLAYGKMSPSEIKTKIMEALEGYILYDDVTMVVVKRKGA